MPSTYLTHTPDAGGNQRKFTFSVWCKKSAEPASSTYTLFGTGQASDYVHIQFNASHALRVKFRVSSSNICDLVTNRLFKDGSAFYHIVVAVDTDQGTEADRVKIYVNGVQETSFSSSTYPSQNADITIQNASNPFNVGTNYEQNASETFDGLMTHFHFTDGTQYAASDFGETDSTSGIWVAKTSPSVTYGTNGFFLKFENSGAMGTDSSGQSNTFAVNGTMTQNFDTPTNNFATLNPLHVLGNVDLPTLTNGNLTYTGHSGTSYSGTFSTIAASSGKWYAEFKCTGGAGAVDMMIGAGMGTFNATAPGAGAGDMVVFGYDGKYYASGSGTTYGDAWVSGDIIGIAMDLDNNKMYIRKNDSAWMNSGDPTSGSTGTGAITLATSTTEVYHFLIGDYGGSGTPTCESNFGQGYFGTTQVASANADANGHGIFEYAVPSGYYSLNTKNLKEFG